MAALGGIQEKLDGWSGCGIGIGSGAGSGSGLGGRCIRAFCTDALGWSILLPFILMLAGCASSASMKSADWTHPTRDSSDWKLDLTDCERFFGATDADKARCMATKGWRAKKK